MAALCPSCGHEHQGRDLASICVGCPCAVREFPERKEVEASRAALHAANAARESDALRASIAALDRAFFVRAASLSLANIRAAVESHERDTADLRRRLDAIRKGPR